MHPSLRVLLRAVLYAVVSPGGMLAIVGILPLLSQQSAAVVPSQVAPPAQLVAAAPTLPQSVLPTRNPPRCAVPLEELLPELLFSTLSPADVTQVVHAACPAS